MPWILTCFSCALSFSLAFLLFRLKRRGSGLYGSAAKAGEIVTDLDAILGRTVGVRFNGNIHRISPLSFEEFLLACNALAELDRLKTEKVVSVEEVRGAYSDLFGICCPSILKDSAFDKLTNQQIAILYNMVLEQIMGKAELEYQKKSQEMSEQKTPAVAT